MARTNIGRGGRGGRGGGHGLSDHAAARGWGQKSIRTNTSGTNTSGTRSETNATMPSDDTGVQEPIGKDEPNTDVSQRRRGSNIIEQVPNDLSKKTMISLDGGEFTDPKVSLIMARTNVGRGGRSGREGGRGGGGGRGLSDH
ncbi:hypothetical protein Tco_1458445 [Tanacetum coccineum]